MASCVSRTTKTERDLFKSNKNGCRVSFCIVIVASLCNRSRRTAVSFFLLLVQYWKGESKTTLLAAAAAVVSHCLYRPVGCENGPELTTRRRRRRRREEEKKGMLTSSRPIVSCSDSTRFFSRCFHPQTVAHVNVPPSSSVCCFHSVCDASVGRFTEYFASKIL